ncbi:MAG: HU family DNA-binding protein [Bacteroidales bacterium]|nr:HU family DNA-binding protein [Bacteroidales bacterium]MDY6347879.1 HU family DNA-binding protein [Bacteroidales bacterium]
MNKSELISAMAEQAGLTKVQAKAALEAFVASTENALKKGGKVSLIGFGSFSVAERKARTGHNPQTGKKIKIAAKKVVKFKAGSAFDKMK